MICFWVSSWKLKKNFFFFFFLSHFGEFRTTSFEDCNPQSSQGEYFWTFRCARVLHSVRSLVWICSIPRTNPVGGRSTPLVRHWPVGYLFRAFWYDAVVITGSSIGCWSAVLDLMRLDGGSGKISALFLKGPFNRRRSPESLIGART